MAAKGIQQRHLCLLYESVVLSAIDYGLDLTTMAQTKDAKECRLGRGKSWMGQTEDSMLQVCQLTEYASKPRSRNGTQTDSGVSMRNLARKRGKALPKMASRQNSQRSSFSFKKTANNKIS